MRKDSLALLLIGFVIGFAALYTWTRERAPAVIRATPRMPEGRATAGSTAPARESGAPAVDMARVEQLQKAVRDNPGDFASIVELGNVNFNQKNYNDAISYYRRALDVRPNDIDVRTDLGTTLFFADRYDEAIAEFRKSLEQNPTHAQTLFNLGVALLQGKNDPEGAVRLWEKLLQSNPGYPQAALVREQIGIVKEQMKK